MLALQTPSGDLAGSVEGSSSACPVASPNLAEVYRHKVAVLHEALEDTEIRAEAIEAIRSMISAIVLPPENGELKIDLQGDIAHILTLASERNKSAALGDGLIEQVKMFGEGAQRS